LIDFKPGKPGTNIAEALRYFTNVIKKRCTAFILSDFLNKGFEDAIKIANKKHDLIAVTIYDPRETEIPDLGLMWIKNAETGKQMWIDTSSANVRFNYKNWYEKHNKYLSDIFIKSGLDVVKIRTDQDYVKPVDQSVQEREARR